MFPLFYLTTTNNEQRNIFDPLKGSNMNIEIASNHKTRSS